MTIGFVFSSAPFGSVAGREGLDAVLATSNYSEDLALFFIADGVMQLVAFQDSSEIYCRNHIKTFKLLPMCDVNSIYLCKKSLHERGLNDCAFVVDVTLLTANEIANNLAKCTKILRF